MTDHVSVAKRSAIMTAVKSKGSWPELQLRSLLHRAKYRFRLHVKALPGSPDIVFPGRRKAILVHGCFWHRHKHCRYATTPKSRVQFWEKKFLGNVRRDRRNIAGLTRLGWMVLVVWQCEMKEPAKVLERVVEFLDSE